MRRAASLFALAFVAACATLGDTPFDSRFGPADPTRFDAPVAKPGAPSYFADIQPVLDRRCVVCHACSDGPCQLKTTSWEGIARGASKTAVYDAARIRAAEPSRLYVDADKASEWRTKDFFPVLNEHAPTPEANRQASLLYRMLALKQEHPLPDKGPVGGNLDFSIDRAASCPAGAQIDAWERNYPQGGMPFGLPGLSKSEHDLLVRWIDQGAPAERPRAPTAHAARRVAEWETFFNGDSNKERLFSRYAYEHLFLAHLYFDDDAQRQYFTLVRSATPPGQPVKIVRSRRPVDDPGVERVYYRLVPERETIVAKTHMPYALGPARMARWRALFLDAPYTVDRLPGYDDGTAANPFATFAALPVGARYRFMLEEAEFTIMGFVKGPVCRGQLAVDVIRDRFWVAFLAPTDDYDDAMSALLARDGNLLRLPNASSDERLLISWVPYAELENEYLKGRTDFFAKVLGGPGGLDLARIWDGDGRNDNAALTVFRHFDNASVVKGFVGDVPESMWVIGYPLLERIHYLLVSNYDVYGNVGHQLNSRLYMDFLRMEAEFNFIVFLPQADREATRDRWYRGNTLSTRQQVYGGPATTLPVESGVRYQTADTRRELIGKMASRLAPVLGDRHALDRVADPATRAALRELASVRGDSLQWLPEMTVLVVESPGAAPATFTLLRDTAHSSVSHLLERRQLRPDEDGLTVASGLIGSYPNAFWRVRSTELPALAAAIRKLDSPAGYAALVDRWGVRRTSTAFWPLSDEVHARYARQQAIEAGVLDYNRLENR